GRHSARLTTTLPHFFLCLANKRSTVRRCRLRSTLFARSAATPSHRQRFSVSTSTGCSAPSAGRSSHQRNSFGNTPSSPGVFPAYFFDQNGKWWYAFCVFGTLGKACPKALEGLL